MGILNVYNWLDSKSIKREELKSVDLETGVVVFNSKRADMTMTEAERKDTSTTDNTVVLRAEVARTKSNFTKTEFADMETRHREAIYILGRKAPSKQGSIRLRTEAKLLGEDLQEYAKKVQEQIEEYQVARAAMVVEEKLALVASK